MPDRDEQDREEDLREAARERVEGKPAPLAPQPCEVHGEVDDVREIDVDERDREERGVGLHAEDPVGEAGGEDDEREDDERWIDRLDQQVERDDPPAPVRVVAVEVEPVRRRRPCRR